MRIVAVDHWAMLAMDRGLYRALAKLGHDITLVVPRRWIESGRVILPETHETEFRVLPESTIFTGKMHRVIYPNLSGVLAKLQPHILFMNAEPENYLAWQAVNARRRSAPECKVVFITWRNIDHAAVGFPYKLSFLNAMAERHVLRRADYGIAYNQSAKEIFHKLGFSRLTVIPPAVDLSYFKPPSDPSVRTSFTIGYVGRFIKEKGIDLLLRASAELRFPHRLMLVGAGPERPLLESLARTLKIEDRVEWHPSVPHSGVPRLLSQFDALVLPSITGTYWKEQFGRVLIEAMACGVPVIGSASGEIPEVIGDAGLIFDENNVLELRDRLASLHDDRALRQALAERGLRRVQSRYSIEAVAARYAEVFRHVAGLDSRQNGIY